MQQFAGDASNISHVSRSRKTRDSSGSPQVTNSCGKCGRRHAPTVRCPADGSTCNDCGKLNHWQRVCRQATCRMAGVERRQPSSGRHRSRTMPGHRANRDERQRGEVHSINQNARSDQLSNNVEPLTTSRSKPSREMRHMPLSGSRLKTSLTPQRHFVSRSTHDRRAT